MQEKEKMLNGELYIATDKKLSQERINCKLLCQKYNNLKYDDFEKRTSLLREILGKTSDKFFIEQPFVCDYGYNIEIGKNFYSNHNLVILDPAKVIFGDNVFIGCNTNLIAPLKVGNNAFIAAGSTITEDVPDEAFSIARERQVTKEDYARKYEYKKK